jgi:hypothetical protein
MQSKTTVKRNSAVAKESAENSKPSPRALAIANKGVKTGTEFASLMSALMSDLIEGSITPQVGNATCNAGGKLLKVVEMTYKYGTQCPNSNNKVLHLTASVTEDPE